MATVDLGKITASVAVGTVTTGSPGTSVSVTNSGTTQDAVLNFQIPQGAKGDTVILGNEEEYTLYNTTGQNTDGAMTQKAVTDNFAECGNSSNPSTDLDIVDDDNIILVRFKDGQVKTKNFDSATDAPCSGDSIEGADLVFSDETGYDIVRFEDGHIRTKYFDSSEVGATGKSLKGKKISILGDSISTAQDNNAVQYTILTSDISNSRTLSAYPTYYDVGKTIGGTQITSSMIGVLTNFTPTSGDEGKTIGQPLNYNTLTSDKLWWGILASTTGATILQNVSWSGASMSSHEGSDNKYKTSYAWHDAQIAKLASRDTNGNTVTPDVVIIYRGTNDMSHSPYSKLTDFGAANTSIPNNDSVDGGYGFKEAYAITIKKIREAYPQAEIICCTLNVFKRINYSEFPTNNGTNTLPQFNNAIREVADQMGCHLIEFDKDGITFENCYPTYISDSATIPTHPNANGHAKMANCAIAAINGIFKY